MIRSIALAATLVAAAAAPVAAQSSGHCGERTTVLAKLASGYSEAPVGVGLTANGAVIEVLASKSGSWTMIVTRPNGVTCLIAHGEAWQAMATNLERPEISH